MTLLAIEEGKEFNNSNVLLGAAKSVGSTTSPLRRTWRTGDAARSCHQVGSGKTDDDDTFPDDMAGD